MLLQPLRGNKFGIFFCVRATAALPTELELYVNVLLKH